MGAVCCARCGSYYLHQLSPYPGNWGFLIGIAVIARRKQLFFCVVFAEEKWLSQCLLLMKLFSSPLPGATPAIGANGSPAGLRRRLMVALDRKSTRLNSSHVS